MKASLIKHTLISCMLLVSHIAAATTSPTSFVERVFDDLVVQIRALDNRPTNADIEALFAETLDPHIDYSGLARWTLRDHWNDSSDVQRVAFLTALKKHVIKTYASALTFDGDTRLNLNQDVQSGKNITQVSGTIETAESSQTNVQFRLVGSDGGSWQIFDVGVHGISVAKTLRAEIAAVAGQGGIDAATSALSSGKFQLVSQR
ncbi:MAG: MlaC/ttg2D family ABC transporter substrate-binding protein [Gammaproteobacteria bacterium]